MKHIDKNKIYLDKTDFYSVLDQNGNLKDKKYKTKLTNKKLLESYKYMVLSREQDAYMTQLQRQGRMLTFAPNFGEEGLQVAVAAAMSKDDWFVPAFRSNATMLMLGVPLEHQLYYWNGNEKGSKIPEGVNVLPINIPIATQFSHATGVAYGMKLKGKKNVAVTFIGDGGTAEGEFYEAMNFASIHKLPVIFCINNNHWAISTQPHWESGSKTLAAKGVAAGVPAVRVDGNDVLASYEVMAEAVQYAKGGHGPVLIEFLTWRQGPHTSSDNPRIYRTKAMEEEAEKNEPFNRIEKYMIAHNLLKQDDVEKIREDQLARVKKAYQSTLGDLDESIDEIFDYTYEKLPAELLEQKADLQKYLATKGDK